MIKSMKSRTFLTAFCCLGFTATAFGLEVGNNAAGPRGTVTVPSGAGGTPAAFSVSADFTYVSTAGPAFTNFTNTNQAAGIPAGQRVSVTETFTNTGSQAWSRASEGFFDITARSSGGNAPAFLFDASTLSVRKNGELQAADFNYFVTGTPYSDSANSGFVSLTLTFANGSTINPGDTLTVNKVCFKPSGLTSGDWQLNEAARASQSVTLVPEPAIASLAGIAIVVAARRSKRSMLDGRSA